MKTFDKLPSFQSVTAGSTATLDIPADGTYHGLLLNYGTDTAGGPTQVNMEAEIDEMRLVVDDKVQRRCSGEELFDINQHHGQGTPTDGFLRHFFAEPWRRSAQGEDALAWGMGDVGGFQIEIDINAGATNPTLSGKRIWTPDARPMGQIVKWRKEVIPVTAIGEVNWTPSKRDALYAIHCHSADIDEMKVEVDNDAKWDLTEAEMSEIMDINGRTHVAGWYHAAFDVTNRVHDALAMTRPDGSRVKTFEVDFQMAAATSFTVVKETLGLRD